MHKVLKCRGKQQCHRRIVTEQYDSSFQKSHCRQIRPLGRLKLRKGRHPVMLRQLFQYPTVQYTVYGVFIQCTLQLFQHIRMGQLVHIQKHGNRIRPFTQIHFLYFQSAASNPFSNQFYILFYGFSEPFFGSTQHFLRLCLRY